MKRFVFPILLLAFSSPLSAQNQEERTARITSISKLSATTSGDRGTFSVPSVETLNRNQFSFGVGWNNFDRTPQDLDINSVPVFFSYGLTGRITVTATMETQKQIAARNLSQQGFYNQLPFVSDRFVEGYGDTTITGKYRIQSRQGSLGGISISGFVKIPTADAEKGLGTGEVDGGLDLVFTSSLPWRFLLHSSMGVVATRDAVTPIPLGIKDEMRTGIGVLWPVDGVDIIGGSIVQGMFEYVSTTFIGAGSPNEVIQAPTDVLAGLRFIGLGTGMVFNAGYRRNRGFDKDFPGNTEYDGFIFGVSYTKPVPTLLTNNFPLIVLEIPSDEVTVGESLQITATGFDADTDPLSYSWTSTGGQVVGTGESVTFDTTGLSPGQYTIRAVANDGRGGTSASEVISYRPQSGRYDEGPPRGPRTNEEG